MNYSAMLLPALKTEAKAREIKGFSTMKKADLITALEKVDAEYAAMAQLPSKSESMVDAIKAAIRNAKDARSNKGRKAGSEADVSTKMSQNDRIAGYCLQRGSATAALTARQARRVRKAERSAF